MLSLLLAMSAAVETPRVVTLPPQARPVKTTVTRRTPQRSSRATLRGGRLCVTGSCTPTAASPYRLNDVSETRFNGKMDAVGKQSRMACGVQGAPVCPGRGTTLTSMPIN